MYGLSDQLLLQQGPLVEDIIGRHAKFLSDPNQIPRIKAVASMFAPFRPPISIGAPIEVAAKSDPRNCSILPFAISRAEGPVGTGIFRTLLIQFLRESFTAFVEQRKAGAEWKLPPATATKLSHIRSKLDRALKTPFPNVPPEIDVSYALMEIAELGESKRFPPGVELLSSGESGEIDEAIALIIDEMERPAWEQFFGLTVRGGAEEKPQPVEAPLVLSEAGAPLACLMERFHRSQLAHARKSKLRPLVVGYLALCNRTWMSPLARLTPDVLRDAASLIGKHGESYVRWILLLQLWNILGVTQGNFEAVMKQHKIQGLDMLKVTKLPALVTQAKEELKGGSLPTNCRQLCERLRRELDANWDKNKKKIYVPDDYKTFLRWLQMAIDIASFLEMPPAQ